jgi:hypothetical protein
MFYLFAAAALGFLIIDYIPKFVPDVCAGGQRPNSSRRKAGRRPFLYGFLTTLKRRCFQTSPFWNKQRGIYIPLFC